MYDRETREQAARLLEEGRGHRVISNRLNIPVATARQWARAYAVGGEDALLNPRHRHRAYSLEEKLAVARDRIEHGLSVREVMVKHKIASESSVKAWCRLYRAGGVEALKPKPRGRRPLS